ncbi:MAG TPA: VOC family protein [Chloroflexota bacterium]|jgi:catechol 2,3-dioxygenase-like lactoylglutathione lyase family enzyme|nr:VOC family protein [Chloroflexota bacterium]
MTPRLDAIGIVVQDMARSLAFYRLLGLDIPPERDSDPHVDCEFSPGVHLLWDTVDTIHSFDPGWSSPSGSPRMGVVFQLDTPAEVDDLYKKMVSSGYAGHKEPWDAFWGMRYAVLHDPDGNNVDLGAALK